MAFSYLDTNEMERRGTGESLPPLYHLDFGKYQEGDIMKSFTILVMGFMAINGIAADHARIGQKSVSNPMKYAEKAAQRYARESSDMPPYSVSGCDYTNGSEAHPSIACSGTKTILFHGGVAIPADFSCDFEFEKREAGKFHLVTEECN